VDVVGRLANAVAAVRTASRHATGLIGRATALVDEQIARNEAAADAQREQLKKVDAVAYLSDVVTRHTSSSRREPYKGLVGVVYDELRDLAAGISAAGSQERSLGEPEPVERIVLHIDDLDRCTPERVVDVLQAINLLQTIELFAVVVSVDARWLRRSLEHHDRVLFEGGTVHAELSERVGDPSEYLDKIFQIPFALPGLTGDSATSYLKDIARHNISRPATAGDSATPIESAAELELDESEVWHLAQMARLATTPRSVKKLLNVYRLARLGSIRDGDLNAHQILASLLALTTCTPAQGASVLDALAQADDERTFLDVITTLATEHDDDPDSSCDSCEAWRHVITAMTDISITASLPATAGACKPWIAEARRYTFHSAATG
jgi:hypothetical protein